MRRAIERCGVTAEVAYAQLRERLGVRRRAIHWLAALNRPRALTFLRACGLRPLGARFVPLNWRLPRPSWRDGAPRRARRICCRRRAGRAGATPCARWRRWPTVGRRPAPGRRRGRRRPAAGLHLGHRRAAQGRDPHPGRDAAPTSTPRSTPKAFDASTRTLAVLPLFHVGGLCIQVLPTLAAGGVVNLHARFDAGAWLADVTAWRPEHQPAGAGDDARPGRASTLDRHRPVLAGIRQHRLVDRPAQLDRRLPCARRARVPGLRRHRDRAGQLGTCGAERGAGARRQRRPTGAGRRSAPGRRRGLQVRAPNLARGYHGEPDARRRSPTAGFAPADLARVDAEGFLRDRRSRQRPHHFRWREHRPGRDRAHRARPIRRWPRRPWSAWPTRNGAKYRCWCWCCGPRP